MVSIALIWSTSRVHSARRASGCRKYCSSRKGMCRRHVTELFASSPTTRAIVATSLVASSMSPLRLLYRNRRTRASRSPKLTSAEESFRASAYLIQQCVHDLISSKHKSPDRGWVFSMIARLSLAQLAPPQQHNRIKVAMRTKHTARPKQFVEYAKRMDLGQ